MTDISVLSFIYSFANAILAGVAGGLQPLWGRAFGRKDREELEGYFRTGIKINVIASAVIYGVLCVIRTPVVRLFNSDPALVEMASGALPVFAFSFLLMSMNLIFTAYFYSTKQTVRSSVTYYLFDPCCFRGWICMVFGCGGGSCYTGDLPTFEEMSKGGMDPGQQFHLLTRRYTLIPWNGENGLWNLKLLMENADLSVFDSLDGREDVTDGEWWIMPKDQAG